MERKRIGSSAKILRIVALALVALIAAAWLLVSSGLARMRADSAQIAERPTASAFASPSPAAINASPAPTITEPTPIPIYRVEPIDEEVTNILLIGTDSRKTVGSLANGNADTVILASYNHRTNAVTLVSFLRDAVLTIGGLDGAYGKLKTAYTSGGTGMLINTLNAFFGLDIQQYCAVGLNGFVAFVDETMGGVSVTLNSAEIDYINDRIARYDNEIDAVKNCPPVTAAPGMVRLTGAQLLVFVRNRTTALDGGDGGTDYDRAARQQEVLRTIYRQILAEQPISAIPGVITFAMRHVKTNMTAEELFALAAPLLADTPAIDGVSVPFAGTWEYGGDGTGILFYRETTVEKLHTLLYANPAAGEE